MFAGKICGWNTPSRKGHVKFFTGRRRSLSLLTESKLS